MVFKKLSLLFIAFFAFSCLLFSQSLLQKAETGFVKFYLTSANSLTAFDFNGNLYPTGSYSETTSNLLLRYGFSDHLTISADFPFYKTYFLDNSKSSGIGDPVIGFSIGLNQENPLKLAVTANLMIPAGESGQFDNPIPVGWEEYQTQIKFQFEYFPLIIPLSVYGYAGGTLRGNNKNNDLILGLGAGWAIIEPIKISAMIDGKTPIGKIRATPPELNGAGNGLGFTYFTTELNCRILSMDFSYSFRTEIYAQNVSSARQNIFGIGLNF